MSHDEGFPLRHRGVHLPDHLTRLELVTVGPSASPRSRGGGAFRPLVLPQSRNDLVPKKPATTRGPGGILLDDQLANFIGNLTVWIHNAMGTASAHAGFDKVHLYLAFLKIFVDHVVPYDHIKRTVTDIEAYITYLATSADPNGAISHAAAGRGTRLHPRRPDAALALKPPAMVMTSPRATGKGILSPRMLRAMAKEIAPAQPAAAAAVASPPATPRQKRSKLIIELSDHEESILELALFYSESVAQLVAKTTKKKLKTHEHFTRQWLTLPRDKRTRVLKKIKKAIAKQTMFPKGSPSAMGGATATPGVEMARYFSLLTLCIQETMRRISVFSAEIAAFIWKVLCHETLQQTENTFDQILACQRRAAYELHELKISKTHVEELILQGEQEIQRLQAQNMRSLAVWKLEKAEMAMLEQEEAWHGHCKLLLLNTLLALQPDANHPTWLQLDCANADAATTASSSSSPMDGNAVAQLQQGGLVSPVKYQLLPAGAALLHAHLRSRIVYMTHLVVLCRSFLHLHEKRGLREVMESTSTNGRYGVATPNGPPSPLQGQPASIIDNTDQFALSATSLHGNSMNPMERISVSELLTLKEINSALRAIEQLYVCTGASGDHSNTHDSSSLLGRVGHGHDMATQFPTLDDRDHTNQNAFIRSLSYSTMAANRSTGNGGPPFVPAGSTTVVKRRNAEIGVSNLPLGSGRRRSSAFAYQNADQNDGAPPMQPLIRLAKTLHKLPQHIKDVLISPLLETDPIPADDPNSIVASLPTNEILTRIQRLYNAVVEASFSPWTHRSTGGGGGVDGRTAVPLGTAHHSWKSWKSEQFVEFIHAEFIGEFADNDDNNVKQGERAFLTFVASIQLAVSGIGTAANPSSNIGSREANAIDQILFFARLIRLFQMEAHDKVTKNRLPGQVFQIFFYCLHVLQHVAVTKKHIEEGGLSIDVYTAAKQASSENQPQATRPARFVLLESVKTLIMYLLESTSPNASLAIDETICYLSERSRVARVSLHSPITPGAYEIASTTSSSVAAATSSAPPVVNGELMDVAILPLDFAVQAIANAWLQQHKSLLDRLSVAMRAANVSPTGEISLQEFQHVMAVGSAAPAAALASSSSSTRVGQLTQIYASQLADTPLHRRRHRMVRWQELIVVVADEMDLLGMGNRLVNRDFRSIQHALLHERGAPASPWVLAPTYRGGDATALRKVWELHRKTMQENFAQLVQADSALDGLRLWQTGHQRIQRMAELLTPASRNKTSKTPPLRSTQRRKSLRMAPSSQGVAGSPSSVAVPWASGQLKMAAAAATRRGPVGAQQQQQDQSVEMSQDELDVAWRALYYLRLDHTQAHHLADQVRLKQQKYAKETSPHSPTHDANNNNKTNETRSY